MITECPLCKGFYSEPTRKRATDPNRLCCDCRVHLAAKNLPDFQRGLYDFRLAQASRSKQILSEAIAREQKRISDAESMRAEELRKRDEEDAYQRYVRAITSTAKPTPIPCPDCHQIPCRCMEYRYLMNRGSRQETEYQRRAARYHRDDE